MPTAYEKKFIALMLEKQRLLTKDEALEFYVENVMRNDVTCKWNGWIPDGKYEDYAFWELEQKALGWHQRIIGSLVLRRKLAIYFLVQ